MPAFFLRYMDDHDPQALMLKHAVKTLVVGILSIVMFLLLRWPNGIWMILGSVFLMQTFVGDVLRHRFYSLLLSSLIVLLGLFVMTLAGSHVVCSSIILFVLTFVAFYVRKYGLAMMITSLFVLVTLVIAGGMHGNIVDAWQRVQACLLGVVLTFIVAYAVFPYKPKTVLTNLLDRDVLLLAKYMNSVFSDFLCGHADNNPSELHKASVIRALKQTRVLVHAYPNDFQRERVARQLTLFSQTVALNNLFVEAMHHKSFVSLADQIDAFRCKLFHALTYFKQEMFSVKLNELQETLTTFQQSVGADEVTSSFIFIMTKIIDTLVEGNEIYQRTS
jgi:hypothetical protein